MIKEIKLPEIADNVTTAVVLEILVSEGDNVEKDDSLAEMESDKATFELPSEEAGVVKEIKIKEGDEVKVGQVMFTIDTSAGAAKGEEEPEKGESEEKEAKEKTGEEKKKEAERPEEADEEEDKSGEEAAVKKSEEEAGKKDSKEQEIEEPEEEEKEKKEPASEKEDTGKPAAEVPAPPSVRRLAREIGIDVRKVPGKGPEGRITMNDVKDFAKKQLETRSTPGVADDYELPDFSKWGKVRREKIATIRRITGKAMSESWQTIPHVFQFDKADVTELENFRKKYSKHAEKEGAKLTVTAMLLKLTAEALRVFPRFNASLDMQNEEIIYKEYVHIGVAVDTERGLLVPVIRDADKKSILELSLELNELAEKARKKKIMPDDLQGGNFAISNLGGIGGTNFTPIVYRPNVAILGVSRSQIEPVYIDGEFRPRMMLPLSLSYDHRVIDGADGARFLRWLCEAMENPLLTMF
jgi:pyruvate dehydrogenase E2 component (dihydrolipoamide acetyltransferase)